MSNLNIRAARSLLTPRTSHSADLATSLAVDVIFDDSSSKRIIIKDSLGEKKMCLHDETWGQLRLNLLSLYPLL